MQARLVPGDDLALRHAQLNTDVNLITRNVMAMRDLDDHAATRDPVVKLIELFGFLLNSRSDRVGPSHVTKGNLYW
jgi:hypothetical protein